MQNHNPMARTGGPKEALNILGGIWCNQNFRNAKSAFRGDMGYVAYNNIVDRFRWKDGCITEHVSIPTSAFSEVKTDKSSGTLARDGLRGQTESSLKDGSIRKA
jgi:hypothetical protein